jgi:N-succinyldiaminopimelate aminotransferase
MAGATPCYLNAEASNDFAPTPADVDSFENVAAVFLCTPGNPSGRVLSVSELQAWIEAAQTYDFLLISDECYSEIYRDEQSPPPGLLQAAAEMGVTDLNNCIAVGSLSKRSNLPGLRSGYMIGSASQMAKFAQYRTYHGCAMPGHHQQASMVAWKDEEHVQENREQYRQKYAMAQTILSDYLPSTPPAGGFYLWIEVPGGDDEGFTRLLLRDYNLRVLPGRYLGRDINGHNPGAGRVRAALVSATETTQEALERLKDALDRWSQFV